MSDYPDIPNCLILFFAVVYPRVMVSKLLRSLVKTLLHRINDSYFPLEFCHYYRDFTLFSCEEECRKLSVTLASVPNGWFAWLRCIGPKSWVRSGAPYVVNGETVRLTCLWTRPAQGCPSGSVRRSDFNVYVISGVCVFASLRARLMG